MAEAGPPVVWSRRSATAIRRSSSTRAGSTRCTASASHAADRGTPKKSSSAWTPPPARRCGSTSTRRASPISAAAPARTPRHSSSAIGFSRRARTSSSTPSTSAPGKSSGRTIWSLSSARRPCSSARSSSPAMRAVRSPTETPVITMVGGPGQSLMAFARATGPSPGNIAVHAAERPGLVEAEEPCLVQESARSRGSACARPRRSAHARAIGARSRACGAWPRRSRRSRNRAVPVAAACLRRGFGHPGCGHRLDPPPLLAFRSRRSEACSARRLMSTASGTPRS